MKRSLQEAVFVSEIERRIDQLAFELDLDYRFVVGALELIVHGIKNDFYTSTDKDDDLDCV